MKWFKHISESGHDPDIGELLSIFGTDGYYMFFNTIEIMSREFDVSNPGENNFNYEFFINEFRKVSKQKINHFLKITNQQKRIINKITGENIFLKCPKLKDLCDEYTLKQIKLSGQSRDKVGTKSGQAPESRVRASLESEADKEKDIKKDSKKKEKATVKKKNAIRLIKKGFIDQWNKFAVERKLPEIKSITGQRETHLKARISSEDFFSFDELLKVIDEQPWLLGKNDRGWRITFDWIVNAANYTKIMEKNYLHLSPRRDEIGRSQKPLTEEQKKRAVLVEKKREELYEKYKKDFDNLREIEDQRGTELLHSAIKNKVAKYSKELN